VSDDDDMWKETEIEAHNTKCPDCGTEFEVVRPGKIQPKCLCEAYRVQGLQLEESERQLVLERADLLKAKRVIAQYETFEDLVKQFLSTRDPLAALDVRNQIHDCFKHIRIERSRP
jgi:hypothetical protein